MHFDLKRTLMSLGLVGATAIGIGSLPTPSSAQGIYFDGPGVSVGVGDRGWRHHRRFYRDYGYYDDRPYWGRRHYRYYDRW
jgi:hypothetical protein